MDFAFLDTIQKEVKIQMPQRNMTVPNDDVNSLLVRLKIDMSHWLFAM